MDRMKFKSSASSQVKASPLCADAAQVEPNSALHWPSLPVPFLLRCFGAKRSRVIERSSKFHPIKTLTPLERLIYWFFQIHTGVIFFQLHTWTSSFSLRSPDRKVMYWTVEYLRKLVYRFIGSFHVPQHASNHSNYQVRPFLLLPFLDFKPSTVWHLNDCELQG